MTKVAVIQSAFNGEAEENRRQAEALVRRAAADHAQIILLPELFERPYFCKTQRTEFLSYATPLAENPAVQQFQSLAKELQVVLPISFFERSGNVLYNSVAVIDADGAVLGVYRKSHIPDGPGYQEKFYFSPNNDGFRVWRSRYGNLGVGICWDQWFPEAARVMALMGADLLLYPTAIGSEPERPDYQSATHWRTVMRGHAAANLMPLVAANRVGDEAQTDAFGHSVALSFYGASFIADWQGALVQSADDEADCVLCADFDFAAIAEQRRAWGLFRDRRPQLYQPLLSMDAGQTAT